MPRSVRSARDDDARGGSRVRILRPDRHPAENGLVPSSPRLIQPLPSSGGERAKAGRPRTVIMPAARFIVGAVTGPTKPSLTHTAPLPTPELARRVGVPDQQAPVSSFDELGRTIKHTLVGLQPEGWFEGKRVLDFGCGPGKALRHFLPEAERCEFFGCDIHEPSIRWLEEHLSPPLKVFVC